jgi:predicted nucleic acid-binding protein
VIHLDANFLIGAAQKHSHIEAHLRKWLLRGEIFAASAIAWAEFLNGPLTQQNKLDGRFLIQGRVLSFGITEAEIAAQLFNHAKRRRGSMPDCLIAAAAISAKVPLATYNQKDFLAFIPFGLCLA